MDSLLPMGDKLLTSARARVEIGRALEEELGKRHGRNQHSKEEVENFPPPSDLASTRAAQEDYTCANHPDRFDPGRRACRE